MPGCQLCRPICSLLSVPVGIGVGDHAGLQGEAMEWVADLYSDHARELADASLFLEALQTHFEDVS